MTLTPTHLNRLMLPLWQAGVPRPTLDGMPLVASHAWHYEDDHPNHYAVPCDDQTAAERIEWGVDRFCEGEASKTGGWYTVQPAENVSSPENYRGWIAYISEPTENDIGRSAHHDTDRLLAKLALAYALLGMEMPKENQ